MAKSIAFQGELGAYSHQACAEARPDHTPFPCDSFQDAVDSVRNGICDLGMIAVENSTYGRVADVHSLLPDSQLHIVDEHFIRVHINLLGLPGAQLDQITDAHGHVVILPQCGRFLRAHDIAPRVSPDNARAARDVADGGDPTQGALASALAAEIYGLSIIAPRIEDNDTNTTRFLIMARDEDLTRRGDGKMITSFVFRVRNLPAALYKAMGGFATNSINMIKLESYMVGDAFTATQFYAEVEGHPDDENMIRAFEELDHFTDMITMLGTYPADPRRT
ncbi:prephenate dehydratase [Oceaniglobus ichthyenteri]|uniref:prephenate dehydratase n=1 Tax=Oceaniglobus ichthyenteri TaxID=2136177 RepID=UPI000D37AB6B|nr:prephenate dehydratase [Oceaniglobus ichthyenteri]